MYIRDFGGIKSEGTLYNMEQEYNQSRNYDHIREDEQYEPHPVHHPSKGSKFDFLRNLKIDDLILIAIGILLLLDSEEDNDIFVLIIALLLFF